MNDRYEKIIDLPHHVSKTRPQIPKADRAAQFAPYSALSGYEDAVEETARLTDKKIELDEGEIEKINATLTSLLTAPLDTCVSLTFFRPDKRKSGGAYVTVSGKIEKIDDQAGSITLVGGAPVTFDNILEIYETDDESSFIY